MTKIVKNKKQVNGWSPEVDRKANKLIWFEVGIMILIIIGYIAMVKDML